MRVLITGGYGFIGSFVGEMFAMEGHEVHIIDNLSTGTKENTKFNHILYQINVEDPLCEEIFKTFKFDVVIHLAAQVNVAVSMDDPYIDSKYNVLGLSNMLNLAKKYGVSKVVFASSAAVYGLNEEIPLKEDSLCDPVSPYGMNKWIGEMYCQKWSEIFGLDTLCYRFSNVYGPRQGTVGEGGVVSIFIQRVINGKDLIVYGDGEQTRDFIFVQDVAEAIYRGVINNLSGIYNLSTNTGVSVNQLIETLGELTEIENVKYEKERQGDIKHSRLDNTKIKNDLDWEPFHTYEDGLAKTYHWFNEHKQKPDHQAEKKKINMPEWFNRSKPILPYLENLGIFLFIFSISALVDIHYYMVDYQLVYIILVSILIGKFQSVLSVGMASMWFLTENLLIGRDAISLLIDPSSLVHISVYIFTGLTIRYALDRRESLLTNYREEATVIKEKYHFLNQSYEDMVKVKEELQHQILYTENSIGTVYRIMKDLDSLEPQEIFQSSIFTVEKLMKTKKVALYMYDSSFSKLVLQEKSKFYKINEIISLEQEEHFMDVLNNNKLFVNKNLKKGLPSLIVPVHVNGTAVGVICADGLDFEQLSLFYINMINVIAKLISSSLTCAYEHQLMLENKSLEDRMLDLSRVRVNV
ncbi:NAD-dependent epimerase/dehydratase family protein [Lederbergia citri]|uniref:GDP-mannose 4,6-dehydratase n=1 Tax=Lederbergia citri TaxID=2833580 RepID=A0A942YHB8_9BACI|nr:NAD-dependent epimerase/dehydratase family protein [Lederbergia citri]MBS4196427.1 GDP-mannose 4,6-dehydratase [Lederbergia citri]